MQLRDDEVAVLTQLVDELDELLGPEHLGEVDQAGEVDRAGEVEQADGSTEGADSIAGLSWPAADPVSAPADPALRRLLPDGYRDDPDAAAEFRRYTDASLREGMSADLHAVRLDLVVIAESGHRLLDSERARSWLRVLNRLRLVLATRLGIETADDHERLEGLGEDDPRATPYLLFEWAGYVLSDLLRALD